MPDAAMPLHLSEETARFLQSGLSIILASAADGEPSVGRALACRVSEGGAVVELFVVAEKAQPLLDHLRGGAPIAVAFTRPSTHRTLQIKAATAELRPLTAQDRAFIARSQQAFVADVELLMGPHQGALLRAALGSPEDADLRIVVRPNASFEQTPGPRAGQPLTSAQAAPRADPSSAIDLPARLEHDFAARQSNATLRPERRSRPVSLAAIRACLEGIIPAAVASCAPDGTPNVTYVSQVEYVDADHVALTFQFFNKTRENVLANPRVSVLLIHPDTGQSFRLALHYLRTESEGPLFEAMKARLAGIASHSGMARVFRLLGADVYRVRRIDPVPGMVLVVEDPPCCRLEALRRMGARLQNAGDLSELTQTVLDDLAQHLDMQHSMVLLLDPAHSALYAVASRGYADSGVGAEIALGQGVIGVAGQQRTPIRIGYYTQDSAYSQAIRAELGDAERHALETEIPLPGLPQPHSQLAVPICQSGRLLGVLFVESMRNLRFDAADEDTLVVLAQQLGQAIVLLQAQADDPAEPGASAAPTPPRDAAPLMVRHFAANDSVFLDEHYLIKGVAGAIFMRLVRDYVRQGRTAFSNKELRLDSALGLPDLTDNLEARLILLDRRLAEQQRGVLLEKTGRGRFRLVVQRPLRLVETPGSD